MPKEYIEREALKRILIDKYNFFPVFIKNAIEEAPTADVVEVKHGEWIEDGYNDCSCVCSFCGAEAPYTSVFEETFDYDWEENLVPTGYEETKEYIRKPYCPDCGAKMDGERRTE